MNQFESGPFEQVQNHQQIPFVSIFITVYLREKEDFLGNSVCARKGVAPCLLCVIIKVSSLLHAEKISSEYLNNRNSLISTIDLFESEPFGQFQTQLQIPIVSIVIT